MITPSPPSVPSEDVDDQIVPEVSTPTPLPSYGPAISPLSPSYAPAYSPTSTVSTHYDNSNTYSQNTPSAADKGHVIVGYIFGLGFFVATLLIL